MQKGCSGKYRWGMGLGARGSKGEEGEFALLLLGPFGFRRRPSVSSPPRHPLPSLQLHSSK